MKVTDRNIAATAPATDSPEQRYDTSHASFSSGGTITIRNFNSGTASKDQIIQLSRQETQAIIELFKQIGFIKIERE